MRTNIVIDDKLMKQVMKLSGTKTKRQAIETAMKSFVQTKKRREILDLFGKVEWVGDLDQMRLD